MKKIKCLILLIVLVSCNSNSKKETEFDYSKKPSKTENITNSNVSINRGKLLYNEMCTVCHMTDGKGVAKVFPPLANSDYLKHNQEKSIIGIKKGMSGKMIVNGETYNSVMAPLGLTNEEVADIMNYINNAWGNNYGELLTAEDVTKVIKK